MLKNWRKLVFWTFERCSKTEESWFFEHLSDVQKFRKYGFLNIWTMFKNSGKLVFWTFDRCSKIQEPTFFKLGKMNEKWRRRLLKSCRTFEFPKDPTTNRSEHLNIKTHGILSTIMSKNGKCGQKPRYSSCFRFFAAFYSEFRPSSCLLCLRHRNYQKIPWHMVPKIAWNHSWCLLLPGMGLSFSKARPRPGFLKRQDRARVPRLP